MGNLLLSRERWQRHADPAPEGVAPRASRRWSRRWALWLVLGYLAQVALRVWLSRSQTVPLANPDESAYLVIARVLAHAGAPSDFSYGTLYQSGYPLLLVPIYWFTSNPVTVYHATMVVNAVVNAALMPLAYLAFRRLSVRRWIAFAAAAVAAVVPEGVFYTQYALSDAVFPVVVLAWLLTVHTWLTAGSRRAAYGTAIGSALLAGYAYAVHPRGLVVVIGFAAVAVYAAVRRIVPAWTLAAAGVTLAVVVGVTGRLNRYISALLYPEGPRSLTGEAVARLKDVKDQIYILEMAAGQLWRLTLDTWGIAAIGLVAAAVAVFRRGVRRDLRIMAALTVLVTLAIVYIAPAALPDGQEPTWASGRYPDAMSVTFFIVGIVVLLRVRGWRLVGYAAAAAALAAGTAAVVVHYAGSHQNVTGFAAFNWADPTVLTQGWTDLSVPEATVVGVALLALWVLIALTLRLADRAVVRALAGGAAGADRRHEHVRAGADDHAHFAGHHAGPAGQLAGPGHRGRPQARRQGRGRQRALDRLGQLDTPVVRDLVDPADLLLLRQRPGAGRDHGRRGTVAGRETRQRELAPGPGRLAGRGPEPGLQLGRLARARQLIYLSGALLTPPHPQFPLVVAAPDAELLAGGQREVEAGLPDRAAGTDRLGLLGLRRTAADRADREEQLGVGVAARGRLPPPRRVILRAKSASAAVYLGGDRHCVLLTRYDLVNLTSLESST